MSPARKRSLFWTLMAVQFGIFLAAILIYINWPDLYQRYPWLMWVAVFLMFGSMIARYAVRRLPDDDR